MAISPEQPKRSNPSLREAFAPVKRIKLAPVLHPFDSPPSSPPNCFSYKGEHFTTTGSLGSGCFGVVNSVMSYTTHEEYALKESMVDKLKVKSGNNFTKAHLMEIYHHKLLGFHPNIVSFLQAWREDCTLYLLMELCECSLDGYWKMKRQIAAQEICTVMIDVLQALKHLGTANMGHFDVKPANILRTEDGVYKLADFTVSCPLDKIIPGSEFGDGHYAAPELLNDEFTLKADVYSLGLTLAQISVPADSPLSEAEWEELKLEARLPLRVAQALAGGLDRKVLQMLQRDHHARAAADDLLEGRAIDILAASAQAHRVENTKYRLAAAQRRRRLSMSAAVEREMREPKSPLTAERNDPLFDTDDGFFVMPTPNRNRPCASLGRARRGLNFNLDQRVKLNLDI